MSWKSATCIGRTSGKPLTAYGCRWEAKEAAEWVRERYGQENVPYHCQRCGEWHLGRADRRTPSHACGDCRGRDGRSKATYRSEEEADRRAQILLSEQNVDLRAYRCPHGDGWHLTKEASRSW